MSDTETAANPADEASPAPAAQEPVQQEAQAPAEGDEEAVTDPYDDLVKEALGDESASEEELVDVEYEGKTHKLPASLKDALLRQADYTRKTTEVARERETVQSKLKEAEVVRNLSVGTMEAVSQAKALDLRIAELEATPIDGLSDDVIGRLRQSLVALKEQKIGVQDDIRKLVEADRERISGETAKFRSEAIEQAAKEIPNFDDKRRADLESLAMKLGVPKEDAEQITDASAYKILHLADIGQKFLDRQRATKKVENAQAANPVPEVGGKSTATKDPEKMSTEEWMNWRNKQAAKA